MDDLKSIAVPVTRRAGPAAAKPRRRGRPSPPGDSIVGGQAGAAPAPRGPALPMPVHRFRVGQKLMMAGGGNTWSRTRGLCRIVFLMPPESGSPLRYRVRSETETFDRIVDEADLALPR